MVSERREANPRPQQAEWRAHGGRWPERPCAGRQRRLAGASRDAAGALGADECWAECKPVQIDLSSENANHQVAG